MLSLQLVKDKTGVYFLSVYQSDGVTPQSLSGTVLWFHAAVGGFVINKNSPANGITIQNIAGGLNCATLQIEPADTTSLIINPSGVLQMPCELTLQYGSEAYELDNGTLTIEGNVGTP